LNVNLIPKPAFSLQQLQLSVWQGILALAVDQSNRFIANERAGALINALAGSFMV